MLRTECGFQHSVSVPRSFERLPMPALRDLSRRQSDLDFSSSPVSFSVAAPVARQHIFEAPGRRIVHPTRDLAEFELGRSNERMILGQNPVCRVHAGGQQPFSGPDIALRAEHGAECNLRCDRVRMIAAKKPLSQLEGLPQQSL
jgi:hypothetical protein